MHGSGSIESSNLDKLLKSITTELKKLSTDDLKEEEVNRVKERVKSRILMSRESVSSRAEIDLNGLAPFQMAFVAALCYLAMPIAQPSFAITIALDFTCLHIILHPYTSEVGAEAIFSFENRNTRKVHTDNPG